MGTQTGIIPSTLFRVNDFNFKCSINSGKVLSTFMKFRKRLKRNFSYNQIFASVKRKNTAFENKFHQLIKEFIRQSAHSGGYGWIPDFLCNNKIILCKNSMDFWSP